MLRSYDSRKEPPPEFNCTIWQAGRATSATGLAFKPIQIGQHVFIDEGAGPYNPAPLALDEAAVNEWPGREIGVFVSVGTGKRPPGTSHRQHEWWEDFFGDALGSFAEARRRLIAKIEGCEEIHQKMLKEHLAKRNVKKENYYRLNVEVGVGEFGMNEWNRLADISTSTRRYLAKPEVQAMTSEAAAKLAKIDRMHRRLAAHAAATAGNTSDGENVVTAPPPPPPPPPSIVPPPSNPMAVELPADEIPRPHSSHAPSYQSVSAASDEKFTVITPDEIRTSADSLPHHPTPQDGNITAPPRRSGDLAPYPHGEAPSRPSPPQPGSPRHSGDRLSANTPPPVPPKTPIPYPDDGGGGVAMPIPPPRPIQTGGYANGHPRPPYPVDGPPPAVNKLRKPTYNVR